ncbi:MAG: hypothetical protein KC729_05600 [Candidatus Eisenbacteria bacterium]|uniref:RNA polymerase sigma-70 ECF-like HTH domain-containing protein n=1 Tax=Eiseniibacteriota bacterium TaxID=2212470 RepID=A0A956RPY0_UNCEI|nr:hypothetical protein [Candidatus Eisenbacteria bacterium]
MSPSEFPYNNRDVNTPRARLQALTQLLYSRIRRKAHAQRRNYPDISIRTTELVGQAYLKMNRRGDDYWNDDRHFLNDFSLEIRRTILQRFRDQTRVRTGGQEEHVPFDEVLVELGEGYVLDYSGYQKLEEFLEELAVASPSLYETFQWCVFTEMTQVDVARIAGLSDRQVRNHLTDAKVLLHERLGIAPRAS